MIVRKESKGGVRCNKLYLKYKKNVSCQFFMLSDTNFIKGRFPDEIFILALFVSQRQVIYLFIFYLFIYILSETRERIYRHFI